eukprot:CAMPEP_0202897070 /NCGR_PEP_ID=MMETSP1392-20130828/5927_1 /ASSEMBLY_ACC=CAM_ASM_000868 /TAXON_ID=225041 /ORGANISM="Chlamydomonas chlamydogama, Strain SAG 11-48b" /LENGTH=245 /DNA_ID=CAMNT_0049582623 /DNA_START=286 /DNA_END=1023 /DNA_ORIENTATION=-
MGRVQDSIYETGRGGRSEIMTVDGAVQKTSLMLGVTVLGAAYTWMQIFSGNAAAAMAALQMSKVAGIVGLVSAMATMFKPHWSPISGPLYAAAKGLAIGGMGAIMELRYPGIVLNATMLTLGVAASLLFAFQSRLINVNDNFRNGVMMVTGGFMFAMLGSWLMSLMGVQLPGLAAAGPVGIVICLVSAGLAAANLLLDFDMIRSVARSRMPKWFEWYAGFSLMVTLVWMWTEILRLLGIMGRRDD